MWYSVLVCSLCLENYEAQKQNCYISSPVSPIKIGEESIKLMARTSDYLCHVVTTVLLVLPLLLSFYQYFASPTIQQFYQWLW